MCFGADNPPGIKLGTEAMASYLPFLSEQPSGWLERMGIWVRRVGERSGSLRSVTGRRRGDNGRENAGMSSALRVKITHTVSLRVPRQGLSSSGQSGLRRTRRGKPMDNRFIFLYHS